MGNVRLAAIALVGLVGLACTRPTPGYCGGPGGDARCAASGMICNKMTLLCELSDGGGPAGQGGGGAGGTAGVGGAAGAAPPGCLSDEDCTNADGGPACVVAEGLC